MSSLVSPFSDSSIESHLDAIRKKGREECENKALLCQLSSAFENASVGLSLLTSTQTKGNICDILVKSILHELSPSRDHFMEVPAQKPQTCRTGDKGCHGCRCLCRTCSAEDPARRSSRNMRSSGSFVGPLPNVRRGAVQGTL
ncbi:uncharacterized protein LOC144043857 isoform X2 [Vanacampus margaritifer]